MPELIAFAVLAVIIGFAAVLWVLFPDEEMGEPQPRPSRRTK